MAEPVVGSIYTFKGQHLVQVARVAEKVWVKWVEAECSAEIKLIFELALILSLGVSPSSSSR